MRKNSQMSYRRGWRGQTAAFSSRKTRIPSCRGCRHAQRLADQASLTTEIARLNDCYDGFFALLGNDLDLGSTFLKIKNAIAASPCE